MGKHYVRIHQNLMALPGQELVDIVHSHPMALLQCMEFLKKYPAIKLVEDKDTAETHVEFKKQYQRNCCYCE
jgi:prephenate dehydratase